MQEERAAQLLSMLPRPTVQLIKFDMTPTYKDAAMGVTEIKKKKVWRKTDWRRNYDSANLAKAAPGGITEAFSFKHMFDNALENMAVPPPYDRASSTEALDAQEAALKQHTFLVTGELKLTPLGGRSRIT